ncbi:MAG: pseudouridine synthase [Clostridiales bacterium]|nr:rRNA pseudouridine synthase [Eubacteriales bacterium]MDH7565537.1 pseudouridine synthase [Clostridiales bacterium]
MRETQRLDKLLSNSGYGSRREIKELVKRGAVSVDNVTVRDEGMHIDPKTVVVKINGQVLNYRRYVYVMMNKPSGVVSATYDSKLKTVADILPERYKCFGLFPIGRLDIDTEGLLVMTNDGQLAHGLLSPKKHVRKKYYALVRGRVDREDAVLFQRGVVLDDGYKTMPAVLDILRQGEFSEVELVIYEGKFHQVKRMFKAVGKEVKYLKRVEMGKLKLDEGLKPGECRELAPEEEKLLKDSAGPNSAG